MKPLKKNQNQIQNPKNESPPNGSIDYLELLKKALTLTIKNKFLWIFGIFIALTSGGRSFGTNFGGDEWEGWTERIKIWQTKTGLNNQTATSQWLENFLESYLIVIIIAGIFLILFTVALYIFRLISLGAIIDGANKLDAKIKTGFKKSFREGIRKFWRLLGINLTIGGFILIILATIASPIIFFFLTNNSPTAITLMILGILFFLFILIFLTLITKLAFLFAVCANQGVFSSLSSAYDILRKKFSKIIVAWILEIIIDLVVGIASFFVLMPFIFMAAIAGGIFLAVFNPIALIFSGVTLFLIFLVFESFIRGVYLVFIKSFWVLFFKEIAGEKIKSEEKKIKHKVPAKIVAG